MKNMKRWVVAVFLIMFFPVCAFAESLTVAAAANVEFALKELKSAFEQETGITVKTVIGSSGKLVAQIENGAPFDIFMSADMEYPEILKKEGLVYGEPKVYSYGILVLWTVSRDINLEGWQEVLGQRRIRKIAIASPKTAPYGKQAINAIKYYNLYRNVSHKLVYGESISQASQFIASGAADIGFTAKSVVLAPDIKEKGVWVEVDPKAYQPLAQGVVILNYAQEHHSKEALKFFDFLFSDQAKEIFKKYGYVLP